MLLAITPIGGFLLFLLICVIFPELGLLVITGLLIICEFILRLFGKSFDDFK